MTRLLLWGDEDPAGKVELWGDESGFVLLWGDAVDDSVPVEIPQGGSSGFFGSLRPRPRRIEIDAEALGDLLVCKVKLLPGRARGVSLFAGVARVSAVASGDVVAVHMDMLAIVQRDALNRNYSDEELLILSEAA